MSENPLQHILQGFGKLSTSIQLHFSRFIRPHSPSLSADYTALASPSVRSTVDPRRAQPLEVLTEGKSSGPTTREELGRATWTFLHTLAAQYPDKPTRRQKNDVKQLMEILSRMYPCKECADHFKEVLSTNPVQAGSQHEFSQWMCHVHNVVNRSLGKVNFPCERVDARWGKLDCKNRACDLQGTSMDFEDVFK
ncbi:FAD-linked sulfhydryl oxidase ERV1 [Andrographis paniculata]|uniref:FAD-linked sulfhydryl oxidase ERV1 n=1 Tax=Andrographis paniculata TaxID=175694 RepID=UPI0021E7D6C0|nr:FAD-linked sulfhydryl oxidase ERV1 [Andrographis paniculata]